MLRTACLQGQAWREAGLPADSVAVNLSARQFNDERLAVEIAAGARRTPTSDARLLELEITETLMMQQPERAVETLGELRSIGVRFAVDDFGTGYSSLARLKLPARPSSRSTALDPRHRDDPDDAAITSAVIAMAHSLRLTSSPRAWRKPASCRS